MAATVLGGRLIGVLVVEDDDRIVVELRRWVADAALDCAVEVVGDRDSAVDALNSDRHYDLVVCDLRIPPSAGSLDASESFGIEVHEVARARRPGTPCLFFTGHADETDVYDQIARGPTEDLFGSRSAFPLVQLVRKIDFEKAKSYIETMAQEWRSTSGVTVAVTSGDPFSQLELRPLQIFARRNDGVLVEVEPLRGLSGARAFRARIVGPGGQRRASVFGKVAPLDDLLDEERNLARYAAAHLGPSVIPTLSDRVVAGAGILGGLFFALADRFGASLFRLIDDIDGPAADALVKVRQATEPWTLGAISRRVAIGDLRRRRVPDSVFERYGELLGALPWAELEDRTIELAIGPQHGDLHGDNVLVDNETNVMLIDFAETGEHPLGIDPVILETSLMFHRDRPTKLANWPSVDEAQEWRDIDRFAMTSPCPTFVRACRDWGLQSPNGELGVAVLTYVDAVRQLKYPDTRKDVAAAIAVAAGGQALELLAGVDPSCQEQRTPQ